MLGVLHVSLCTNVITIQDKTVRFKIIHATATDL
jgi:hypothetical protein